jgi:hypothetical protein
VKGGIPNALALRHEQQYDAADRGGDAGDQLATSFSRNARLRSKVTKG